MMKTPPLLLGAALLFWGWQTGFLVVGAILATLLEGARLVKARWEFSDEEFSRLWTFCSVLLLGALAYAFTANEGPAHFAGFIQDPKSAPAAAVAASARTATALFRWLPMILFPVVAAQTYSSREQIAWTTVSVILRRRWEKARKRGQPLLPVPGLNLAFPYFAVCLFGASGHTNENSHYFWGLCGLLAWALWAQRSRRFGLLTWLAMLAIAIALGYTAQRSAGRLQSYLTNLNVELLSRFFRRGFDRAHTRTSLGDVGRLKQSGRIVIRLEPELGQPPTYLRETSYRLFGSPLWSAGTATEESVMPDTNGTSWILLPGKTNVARVRIACYLDGISQETYNPTGLLPLPAGAGQLDNLPAFILKKNSSGAVLAEGPGLVIFDAGYGRGATIDSPPGTNDLVVPTNEVAALEQVMAELSLRQKNTAETLQIVNGFFRGKFSYSTWQEKPKRRDDQQTPLGRFLLETRRGHCEYFATATVLLLRQLRIPARYVVGYAVHEASGSGYVVRQRDAHAWCLVWDDSSGAWQDFDTTPASWVNEESKLASPWQRLSDLWSWIWFQFSKFRWGQTHLRGYLLFLLGPVLLLLLYRILFLRKRRRPPGVPAAPTPAIWPGLDSEFHLVEKKVAERGVRRRPNEPLSAWLQRSMVDPALAGVSGPLHALLGLHYRYRFDPRSLNPVDREELKRGAQTLLHALERRG